ncbi:MAG: protein-glutamate O-methyltransferase CheR [Desulfobacterales bacterium]|nr:protein-glutamate O-methyltransferase CheR [Desulfobacterales bacterium]
MSTEELEDLIDFIYRKTGIRFETKKLYYISKRVEKRIKEMGMATTSQYIRYLRFSDPNGKEFQSLVNLLTVNETYFFRDFPQLQAFAEHSLQEVIERKSKKGDYHLRVWSAGCASGEEPYTIAIILLEMIEDIKHWHLEIIGSDIDVHILKKADTSIYELRSMRDVPHEYLDKYFHKLTHETYTVKKIVKDIVKFEHLNLSDKKGLREKTGFDFIFCRNVLIYFDDISRKQIVDHFYTALNTGGFIFLGSSESVARISPAFKIKRSGDFLVYHK